MKQKLLIQRIVFLIIFTFPLLHLHSQGITGYGPYKNDVRLMVDGILPAERLNWDSEKGVYWEDPSVYFILDLGEEVFIRDILIQVYRGETYIIETSRDGKTYREYLRIMPEYGSAPKGMTTINTAQDSLYYEGRISVIPREARYLRIKSGPGKGRYAISELQVSMVKILASGTAASLDNLDAIDLSGEWTCHGTRRTPSGAIIVLANRFITLRKTEEQKYTGLYLDTVGFAANFELFL